MVTFRRSPSGKVVDREWHERRKEARRNAMTIAEFGKQEITRFDLDTADITGRENRQTYEYNPTIDLLGVSGHIVQELPKHD